jgi:hypothetical protein
LFDNYQLTDGLERMSHFRQQLRFVERPAHRAKPIPTATWLKYKDELCALYQRMTLEELMEHMRKEHDFEASYVPDS